VLEVAHEREAKEAPAVGQRLNRPRREWHLEDPLVRGGQAQDAGRLRSRDDAERVLAKVLGDIAQGRSGLPAEPASIPKLSELAPDYFERRKRTHRAGLEDASRWRKHVAPYFEHLRPAQVDAARMRAFIEAKLAQKANPATVRIYIALLSALFADLFERGIAQSNPARGLPRSTMRLMRSTHDPRTTPFIEKLTDVRRIYLALPEPLNVAYAIGALAGLRTGEVFALRWQHVDVPARRIHVRESVRGPLKDKDSRMVPILDALAPILKAWDPGRDPGTPYGTQRASSPRLAWGVPYGVPESVPNPSPYGVPESPLRSASTSRSAT
jgi:integrase